MKLGELGWPQVTLLLGSVFGILAAAVILGMHGIDPTPVFAFGGILLAGLGVGSIVTGQSNIKEQLNGRLSQLMDLVEKQSSQLARAAPVPSEVAPPDRPSQGNAGHAVPSG